MNGTVREIIGKLDRATPAFRTAFIEELSREAQARFTSAPPTVRWALAEALRSFDDPAAIDGLTAALQSDDVIVRWRAATGLLSLRDRVGAAAPNVLSALEQTARSEPHELVRRSVYLAMLMPDRLDDGLAKLASALVARREQVDQGPAAGLKAETDLFERLARPDSLLRNASERGRADLTRALAAILTTAVGRYTALPADASALDKEALERLILQTESALRVAAREVAGGNSAPDVTAAMSAGGADAANRLQAELAKWVGQEGSPGLLNQAPWDVPVGGVAQQAATASP
jgi:HEAT repeat protein